MSRKTSIQKLRPEVYQAVMLSVEGHNSVQIGKILDKNPSTIRNWLTDPKVQEEYRSIVKSIILPQVSIALRNLGKDLEDNNEGHAYLRQNATFFVLNKYAPEILGETDRDCTVVFSDGVPELGMPDDPEGE